MNDSFLSHKIFTHDEAARIVEMLEDVLEEYGIRVPSPEDDEREPDNMAVLYGSTYYGLLDSIEERLIQILESCKKHGVEFTPYVFSGSF